MITWPSFLYFLQCLQRVQRRSIISRRT